MWLGNVNSSKVGIRSSEVDSHILCDISLVFTSQHLTFYDVLQNRSKFSWLRETRSITVRHLYPMLQLGPLTLSGKLIQRGHYINTAKLKPPQIIKHRKVKVTTKWLCFVVFENERSKVRSFIIAINLNLRLYENSDYGDHYVIRYNKIKYLNDKLWPKMLLFPRFCFFQRIESME